MTGERPQVNPFRPPGPLSLLCPWRHAPDLDFYVDVDDTRSEFERFTTEMGDLSTFLEFGQLVLVTGESGCGKSAMINRCVHWVAERLKEQGLTGKIIDLTRTLNGRPQQPIEARVSIVCNALFGALKREGVLRLDALEELRPYSDEPDEIYPDLPTALNEDRVLIILLPSPGDLANEVIRYTGLTGAKMLFLVESALLDEDKVRDIRHAVKDWIPPITLRVGELQPDDVREFASDRLRRHSDRGVYPRMSVETMNSVAGLLQSVAQLQRVLSETYETRRHSGLQYDEDSMVTDDEIRQQVRNWLGDGP